MIRALTGIALLLSLPLDAAAAIEWADWSGFPASTRTGTFSGGHTITMTAINFAGSGSVPAGTGFTSDVPVPGQDSTANPPYQQIVSGPTAGMLVQAGDGVVDIDLFDLPADAPLLFGISDQKFRYKLELRDGVGTLLPLTGIVLTPYHIKFPPFPGFPDGLVADQNSTLTGDMLNRDFLNDANPTDFYNQIGLTVLSNLPAGTRAIRLLVWADQEAEGLSLYVGADLDSAVEITDTSGSPTDKSISFGTITVGSTSRTHTVTVTNPGDTEVAIGVTQPGLGGVAFVVTDECSGTLQPSSSCTVDVVFQPASAASAMDSLEFDVDGEEQEVSLAGTGTLDKTGDVNGDGQTRTTDALKALRISVEIEPSSARILASSDMNGDGLISIVDALAILKRSVGL